LEYNKKQDIEDFSFKYLKIKFVSKDTQKFLENIQISELNFTKKSNTVLLKSQYNDDIEIYSKFNCKDKDFSMRAKNYDSFSIDSNTKTLIVNIEKNPKYNVYSKKDYDNDWVEDSLDNCKYRYNPNQKDSNGDGRWDVCSDDDGDGIIGFYDNCPYIKNPKQIDKNINNIWDKCEFDFDKDGIFDQLDNCRNISNPEQIDSDGDWIGDICDNSIYYNPRQLDKNHNGIGDVTEEKEKFLRENDTDNDGIIDFQDNCKTISNPNQEDTDKDGIGNMCDNCINIQNKDQWDFDKNGVGDVCEDSDKDGIEWLTDNCISIYNPNQEDSDNDGVWDICEDDDGDRVLFWEDNCPYKYNPDQSDIDGDSIWDVCDQWDNRFLESNKGIFIVLLVVIALLFGFGIYKMVQKIK